MSQGIENWISGFSVFFFMEKQEKGSGTKAWQNEEKEVRKSKQIILIYK